MLVWTRVANEESSRQIAKRFQVKLMTLSKTLHKERQIRVKTKLPDF